MADTLNPQSSKEFEDAEKHEDEENYPNGNNSHDDSLPKQRRIVYDKKFLLDCFSLPSSKKKPVDFPLNDLECTLSSSKILGQTPFVAPQPYVPPKRKDENGRRERTRESDDNISLRPHSGNFSGGCGTNFPTGYGYKERDATVGGLQHIIDEHFLRDAPRNTANLRFPNKRFDPGDRNRNGERDRTGDRDRDMRELRDRDREREPERDRDRLRSDRNHFNNHHRRPGGHAMQDNWGSGGGGDVPEREPEWNRRGYHNRNGANAGGNSRDFKDKRGNYFEEKNYGRGGYYKDRAEEEEPEWFSEGPSSQHDTIELRGFMDDDRAAAGAGPGGDRNRDGKEYSSGVDKESKKLEVNDSARNHEEATEYHQGREIQTPGGTDFSIEKILKMDHIPGLLPNGLLEDEEPSGISKFSQIFQKNLSSPTPRDEGLKMSDSNSSEGGKQNSIGASKHEDGSGGSENAGEEDKQEHVQVLSNALRNMLLKPAEESLSGRKSEDGELLERNLMNLVKPSSSKTNAKNSAKKTEVESGRTDALQSLLSKLIEGSQKPSGRNSTELGGTAEIQDAGSLFSQMLSQGSYSSVFGPAPPNRAEESPLTRLPESFRPSNMPSPPIGSQPQNIRINANPPPQNGNPFVVFQNLIRNQNPATPPREVINPIEVMSMIPREIQIMIENVEPYVSFWREHDCQSIVAAMTSGEYAFRTLLHDLLNPRCDRRPFLASLVQMILSGAVIVPSLQIAGPPLNFMKSCPQPPLLKPVPVNIPPEMYHRPNHLPESEIAVIRDRDREMARNHSAPSSNMAFTPTSVIRKMTADSPKPIVSHGNNMGMNAVGQSSQQINASMGDFSFLVSQITGQNPQRGVPQHNPMHAAQFLPIHQHNPMGPQGHPMMVPLASAQQMMNVPPYHHPDVPRS